MKRVCGTFYSTTHEFFFQRLIKLGRYIHVTKVYKVGHEGQGQRSHDLSLVLNCSQSTIQFWTATFVSPW